MASISYWFLSPSVILAIAGKLKGWDRTRPTPSFDWRSASVDVVVPARNEEASIALCLASLFEQDFAIRKVTVIDDGSTDRTAEMVRRFVELSGKPVDLVVREHSIGKTPTIREATRTSDADALLVLDADTVLSDRNYLARCIEELFKNAGVASVCGEVMPFTRRRRRALTKESPLVNRIQTEFQFDPRPGGFFRRLMETLTVIYRSALYVFLQRILYDGHMKMFGSRLNPIGCAVAYRTRRLLECFEYAQPKMGDNLSNSEDVFIGHFFNWKGWRNVQVIGVQCESIEPSVGRLPRQLYLWSSSFLQALHYFRDLPLSPFRQVKNVIIGRSSQEQKDGAPWMRKRRIQEQYRAPWGEQFTHRFGRRVGLLDLLSMLEKVSYPLILLYFALFNHQALLVTLALEAVLATVGVFVVADRGTKFKSAGMMLAATPSRLLSVGVDLVASLGYLLDMATGNRNWRK